MNNDYIFLLEENGQSTLLNRKDRSELHFDDELSDIFYNFFSGKIELNTLKKLLNTEEINILKENKIKLESLNPSIIKTNKTNKKRKIFIGITSKCNMNCKYCYNAKDDRNALEFLDLDNIKNIVDDSISIGIYKLHLTGGEPTTHPFFDEILSYAYNRGMIIFLNTNGFYSSHQNTNIQKYCSKVNISLDSCDKDIFENNRRVRDSFNRIVDNITILAKNNVNVNINITDNDSTIEDLFKTVNYINKRFKVPYIIESVIPTGRAKQKNIIFDSNKIEVICYLNSQQNENNPISISDVNINKFRRKKIENCGIGDNMIYIKENGVAILCPLLEKYILGNIFKDSISDIFEKANSIISEINEKRIACKNCEEKEKCCGGCLARAILKYDCFEDKEMCIAYGIK